MVTWVEPTPGHFESREQQNGVPDFTLEESAPRQWLLRVRTDERPYRLASREEAQQFAATLEV